MNPVNWHGAWWAVLLFAFMLFGCAVAAPVHETCEQKIKRLERQIEVLKALIPEE